MTNLQYLLTKLAEENSEVAQVAAKLQQFGLLTPYPADGPTNRELAHRKLDDLMGVIEMLNEECDFAYHPNRERIEAKKRKVASFRQDSIALGLVEPQ